ncbi:MAG: Mth938-like domain-containing protein [Pseudomonadota bacterium]|nr:Mth938-like domain-containing protein [Pseudomonadota bacterium]
MKFQPDQFGSAITSYGPGWIAVGGERIEHSLVLHGTGEYTDWACTHFDELSDAHFTPLAAHRPELVVFGSGAVTRFPRPTWVRALVEAGIGVEAMDTGAACRTYNILAGEGRRVIAALLVEPGEKNQGELK